MENGTVVKIEDLAAVKRATPSLDFEPVGAIFEGTLPHYYNHYAYVKLTLVGEENIKGTAIGVERTKIEQLVTPLKGMKAVAVKNRLAKNAISRLPDLFYAQAIEFPNTGADPEIFVVDDKAVAMPAWEWAKSKKQAVINEAYWDGVQAEFTIKPNTCHAYTVDYLHKGLVNTLTQARKKNAKAKLCIDNVVEVGLDVLEKAEPEHAGFGCNPSLNLYGNEGLQVANPKLLPIRFAGGHIHFGCSKFKTASSQIKEETIRALDLIIGLPSVAMFKAYEKAVRRQFYGLAGEYREPAHGLEYRTLSNAWLCHPAVSHLTLDMARVAFRIGINGLLKHAGTHEPKEIARIINETDVKAAKKFVEDNKRFYAGVLRCYYLNMDDKAATKTVEVLANGVDEFLKNPKDLENNWLLKGRGWQGHSEGKECQWQKAVSVLLTDKTLS